MPDPTEDAADLNEQATTEDGSQELESEGMGEGRGATVEVDEATAESTSGKGSPDPWRGVKREAIIKQYEAEHQERTKLNERLAKLEGVLEGMRQRDDSSEDEPAYDPTMDERQRKFNDEWSERIEKEPGKATVEYMQGAMREFLSAVRGEMDKRMSQVSSRIEEYDPDYRAHQQKVDEVVKEFGVDRRTAIGLLKKFGVAGKVSQPPRPKVPGRTADSSGGKAGTPPKAFKLPSSLRREAARSGLKEEDIAAIEAAMAGENLDDGE